MKKIIQLLFLFLPLAVSAQEKGIHFESELSWKEIQAKAKAENKYIFLDYFALGCGACQYLSSQLFPKEKVGDFFNKHFINVKVQFEKWEGDNEYVKKWYDDAEMIAKKYDITGYPLMLFFSPDGKPVHRKMGAPGGSDAVERFISEASQAFDTSKQYYTLLEKFNNNPNKQPAAISEMALAANKVSDSKVAKQLEKDYLNTQDDLFTKQNIKFLIEFTKSNKDTGFAIFKNNVAKIRSILGDNSAMKRVCQIIQAEMVYSNLPKGRALVTDDWKMLTDSINYKYPGFGNEVIADFKIGFYERLKDWNGFYQAVDAFLEKYGTYQSALELNNYGQKICQNSSDIKHLESALKWSGMAVKMENKNPYFTGNYAILLYKSGRIAEATEMGEKAIVLAEPKDKKMFEAGLDMMKKGEKMWSN